MPGTAGLGDPGNSVVVGRRAAFGAPFGKIGSLRRGAEILVTTAQGQSVYRVSQVATTTLYPGSEVPAPSVGRGAGTPLPVSARARRRPESLRLAALSRWTFFSGALLTIASPL